MNKIEVNVDDLMQKEFSYFLTEAAGKNFHAGFLPQLTPKQMLTMGVFGGKYMTDCTKEFPDDWFENAKLCHEKHLEALNFYGVNASLPLQIWQEKGWIFTDDPRGWFQWFCRYYMGRRGEDDLRQISRWKAMIRHLGQLKKNCVPENPACRRRQKQALLNWSYDCRNL